MQCSVMCGVSCQMCKVIGECRQYVNECVLRRGVMCEYVGMSGSECGYVCDSIRVIADDGSECRCV
jgi:hypothetical protein